MLRLPATVSAISLRARCVGVGGDTPKRPTLAVTDEVQRVEAGKVIGTWTCRELDLYPELPQQVSTITCARDGTFTAAHHRIG